MRLHLAPETGDARSAPTTVVVARALQEGSMLRSAGPAVAAAVVTATIFGACVLQVTRQDAINDNRGRVDEDALNASEQPAAVRAAPLAEYPSPPLESCSALADAPAPACVSAGPV